MPCFPTVGWLFLKSLGASELEGVRYWQKRVVVSPAFSSSVLSFKKNFRFCNYVFVVYKFYF